MNNTSRRLSLEEVRGLEVRDVVYLRDGGNRYMVDVNTGSNLELRNLTTGRSNFYSVSDVVLYGDN